jgi:hypothetical protein
MAPSGRIHAGLLVPPIFPQRLLLGLRNLVLEPDQLGVEAFQILEHFALVPHGREGADGSVYRALHLV